VNSTLQATSPHLAGFYGGIALIALAVAANVVPWSRRRLGPARVPLLVGSTLVAIVAALLFSGPRGFAMRAPLTGYHPSRPVDPHRYARAAERSVVALRSPEFLADYAARTGRAAPTSAELAAATRVTTTTAAQARALGIGHHPAPPNDHPITILEAYVAAPFGLVLLGFRRAEIERVSDFFQEVTSEDFRALAALELLRDPDATPDERHAALVWIRSDATTRPYVLGRLEALPRDGFDPKTIEQLDHTIGWLRKTA
jgi:hypothetical protein